MTQKPKSYRIFRPCWIVEALNEPPTEHRICEFSDVGATIAKNSGTRELPNEFILLLTLNGAVGRKCKVICRSSNDEVGVAFTGRVPVLKLPPKEIIEI